MLFELELHEIKNKRIRIKWPDLIIGIINPIIAKTFDALNQSIDTWNSKALFFAVNDFVFYIFDFDVLLVEVGVILISSMFLEHCRRVYPKRT